jgi:cell division septation protein DedD
MNAISFKISMKAILIAIALIALAGILIGYVLYNKPHRSVADEQAVSVPAGELFKAFETDENTANSKYLNKVVAVSGVVSEVSTNMEGKMVVILQTDDPMFGVSCTLADSQQQKIEKESAVIIKGICTGYLSDVVIVQGIVLNVK